MPKKVVKKNRFRKEYIYAAVVVLLLGLLILPKALTPVNTQCTELHNPTSTPPVSLITANDYFDLGNYDYDRGNCAQAITDYTYAIFLNPNFAEAYNNRAFTYMMQNDYANAIPDLNKAIDIRPTYVHALMNRADIYNFYYNIDHKKALADYNKVITLAGTTNDAGICNHRLLAIHNGWSLGVIKDLILGGLHVGCTLPVTTIN